MAQSGHDRIDPASSTSKISRPRALSISSSMREKSSEESREFEERIQTLLNRFDLTLQSAIAVAAKSKSTTDLKHAESLDNCLLMLKIWLDNFNAMIPDTHISETLTILLLLFPSAVSSSRHVITNIETQLGKITEHLSRLSDNKRFSSDDIASPCQAIREFVDELDKLQQSLVKEIESSPGEIESLRGNQTEDTTSLGIPVLCFDGGGVRSYSSLLILEALMREIETLVRQSDGKVKLNAVTPHEVFRFIFGSSSGGLVAIMLGRLKMNLYESQETFLKFARQLFLHPRPAFKIFRGLFNSTKYTEKSIIKATQVVVGSFDPHPGGMRYKRDRFAAPGEQCKCGVVAYSATDGPHLFRNYEPLPVTADDQIPENTYDSQIWEVARATTAAPSYFPPAKINGNEFIDGGLGSNNPTVLALNEVLNRHPKGGPCIVSIGSGTTYHEGLQRHFSSSTISSVIRALRLAATDTEDAHRALLGFAAHSKDISYFRFNVRGYPRDIALDDWAAIDEIKTQTIQYLNEHEVRKSLRLCAQKIIESHRPALPRAPPEKSKVYKLVNLPLQNPTFYGREDIMEKISYHLSEKNPDKSRLCVLSGVGGIGKTQIALEYSYRQRSGYSYIIWIQAEDTVRLSEGFYCVASAVGISIISTRDLDPIMKAKHWLSNTDETWLLVFDEVRDMDALMPIMQSIAGSPNGSIIITTRLSNITIAGSSIIKVPWLSPPEGAELLGSLLRGHEYVDTLVELAEILKCSPVAIDAAAAFMRISNTSASDYLLLLKNASEATPMTSRSIDR